MKLINKALKIRKRNNGEVDKTQIILERCPGNFGLPNIETCLGNTTNCPQRLNCWGRDYKWWMRFYKE